MHIFNITIYYAVAEINNIFKIMNFSFWSTTASLWRVLIQWYCQLYFVHYSCCNTTLVYTHTRQTSPVNSLQIIISYDMAAEADSVTFVDFKRLH